MKLDDLNYLSKLQGCGGRRGEKPEDFNVEEIIDGKRVSMLKRPEGNGLKEYIYFVLTKKGITTEDALTAIAKELKIGRERLNVAGQKDKNAITTQLVSCWSGVTGGKNVEISPSKIVNVKNLKDISIHNPFYSSEKLKIGDLTGNAFKIRLTGVRKKEQIEKIIKDNNSMVPNYFGPQRFGMKQNNATVARYILLKQYRNAVYAFLAENEKEFLELNENGISEEYLSGLRKGSYEWLVGRHLLDHEGEYLSAIKKIPRTVKKLIVQSYQSYLFNLELSERIRRNQLSPLEGEKTCGFNKYGFIDPEATGSAVTVGKIIGYNTKANEITSNILWNEGVELGDFKFRDLPELASEGFERPLLINVKDLKVERETKSKTVLIFFELPKGGYATSVLREITALKRQ